MPKYTTTTSDRTSSVALGAMTAAVLGLAATSSALGQAGTFTIRMNDGAQHSVTTSPSLNVEPGTLRYTGSAVDPAGQWEASWDYVADLDPNGNAKLVGSATVLNKSSALGEFDVRFRVPICPLIMNGAKMGGSCTIKLTASENGGVVSCPPGHQVFGAMADDVIAAKLFHGPFNMGTTGSGTCQTQNIFGAPFPAMNVPEVSSDFGVKHIFKLTDADSVQITTSITLGGDANNFVECASQAQAAQAPASPAMPSGPVNEPTQVVSAPVAPGAPSSSAVTIGGGDDGAKRVISAKGTPAPRNAMPKRAPSKSAAKSASTSRNSAAKSSPNRSSAAKATSSRSKSSSRR